MVRNEFGFGNRIAQAKPRAIALFGGALQGSLPARLRSLFDSPTGQIVTEQKESRFYRKLGASLASWRFRVAGGSCELADLDLATD